MTDRELLLYVYGFLNGAVIDQHNGHASAIYDARSLVCVMEAIASALKPDVPIETSKL